MSAVRPVTIVTGASSGIGTALARVFARHGHELVLVARREDRLKALAAEIATDGKPAPLVLSLDLAANDATARIAKALDENGLAPQFVVNNAGFGLYGRAGELDRGEQLHMIDLNVRALTELSLAFAGSLADRRGGILNVASVAAFLPGPGMAVYYASKAYVLSFTEAMRGELGPKGVRITALCPGPVPTEFQGRAGLHAGLDSAILNVSAAAVARAGYRGLMANKRLVLPGVGVRMIPFMLRFAPRSLVLASVARVQQKR